MFSRSFPVTQQALSFWRAQKRKEEKLRERLRLHSSQGCGDANLNLQREGSVILCSLSTLPVVALLFHTAWINLFQGASNRTICSHNNIKKSLCCAEFMPPRGRLRDWHQQFLRRWETQELINYNADTAGHTSTDAYTSSSYSPTPWDYIIRLLGKPYKLRSKKQLRNVAFNDVSVPSIRRCRGGPGLNRTGVAPIWAQSG